MNKIIFIISIKFQHLFQIVLKYRKDYIGVVILKKSRKLIQQNKLDSNDIRFFLGYSGWETNQLSSELLAHTWILSENMHHKTIIEKVNTSFWKEKMLELGGDYSIWSNAPENPSYN